MIPLIGGTKGPRRPDCPDGILVWPVQALAAIGRHRKIAKHRDSSHFLNISRIHPRTGSDLPSKIASVADTVAPPEVYSRRDGGGMAAQGEPRVSQRGRGCWAERGDSKRSNSRFTTP